MKNIRKLLCVLFSFWMICFMFIISGCSSESSTKTKNIEKKIITDLSGRKVEVKNNCKKAIAIGPGALRLYCYVNGSDNIVGVENIEKTNGSGRPYLLAYSDMKDLDIIGVGGPNNAPDPEKILSVNPDVVFSTYADADKLQQKIGIPVISLSYGDTAVFNENLYKSIEIIGKVMNNNKRACDVVDYIKNCKKDLEDRTYEIYDKNKPKVYTGAMSMRGSHGIESSQGNNPIYNALHAINVVDETGKEGSLMINKEQLMKWDPDIIFIDYGGLSIVKDDYEKNSTFYNNLKAFKNGEIYSLQPYNHYTTNIDTALTDAYYIGYVIYPDKFKDINPETKADEIYEFLLDKKLYNRMSSDFGEFKKLSIK